MMKNTKIMALVALVAVLAGLIGLIVCVTPGQSAVDRVVANYVSAINSGNTEKMQKMGAESIMSDMMGGQFGGGYGDLDDAFGNNAAPVDGVYSALQSSAFSAAGRLPEGVTEVKSVKIVGCVDGERESLMGLTGISVGVVLEVKYVDAEGEPQSMYSTENIGVIQYKNKYYIAG